MKTKTPLIALALTVAFTAFASATPAPATVMLEAMKVSAASNSFASDVQFAHSEAVRRNSRVVLCQSADGVSCTNSGSWSKGWIVFDDADGDGVRASHEQLIVRVPKFSQSLRFTGAMEAVRAVSFTATGGVRLAGSVRDAVSLTICSQVSAPAQARQVILQAGRALQLNLGSVTACA
jgi:type IV fimbrial biogenesis protein FimT